MEKLVHNISKAISYLFMALATIFMIWIWKEGDTAIEDNAELGDRIMNPFMLTTFIAFGLAVVLAVVLPIFDIFKNPKQAVKTLAVIGGMGVLAIVAYTLADNTYTDVQLEKLLTTAETSKLVGAGLYFTYIMGAVAIIATLFSGVNGAIKKA
ncbi:MAG: hypothetical protein JEZ03_14645 [Bacteroidales bacterium]|nr:hypothetical protein [Bacteroidales bacterium]